MSLIESLVFDSPERDKLAASIAHLTMDHMKCLDDAVTQYNSLYKQVGFKENLHRTLKWLSLNNIQKDAETPHHICDMLNGSIKSTVVSLIMAPVYIIYAIRLLYSQSLKWVTAAYTYSQAVESQYTSTPEVQGL